MVADVYKMAGKVFQVGLSDIPCWVVFCIWVVLNFVIMKHVVNMWFILMIADVYVAGLALALTGTLHFRTRWLEKYSRLGCLIFPVGLSDIPGWVFFFVFGLFAKSS